MDSSDNPILVKGVPGRVGGVGSAIVEILRRRGLPVRALVLREDERTDALRANGVDVVVGDLTEARDVSGDLSRFCGLFFCPWLYSHHLWASGPPAPVRPV